jgi:hypothetical protein
MLGRKFGLYLVLGSFIGALATGCKKSPPSQSADNPKADVSAQPPAKLETVVRIHWLGKRRLATETNAAAFMSIWAMPESQKLEAQTLDKLALAPWNLPRDGTNTAAIVATNANSLLLRPLLEDLLQEECYLEIRSQPNDTLPRAGNTVPASQQSDTYPSAGSTAGRTEIALAIRVDDARSHLWKTNLAAILESLQHPASSNQQPVSSIPHPTFLRTRNWTVIDLSPSNTQTSTAATSPSTLNTQHFAFELAAALGQNDNLFSTEPTNSPQPSSSNNPQIQPSNNPTAAWLETELDLNGISSALGLAWHLPANSPKVSLTMLGKGDHVRTTGRLNFREPLNLDIEAWNIPTNLIHNPLESFTAIRGIRPLLAASKIPAFLRMDTAPNQFFLWSQTGLPFQTYAGAPLSNASNYVWRLEDSSLDACNQWLATNGLGEIRRTTNGNKVKWTKVPYLEPFLQSQALSEGEFVFGGFGPTANTNHRMPVELLQQVLGPTNLVAYDWELSGPRIDNLLYVTQIMRAAVHRAQLPTKGNFIPWFEAIALKLGNSGMTVTMTGPKELSFVRTSTLGFSALELHFLADWLESPHFPSGLHTILAPPDQPIHVPAGMPK